MATLHDKIFAHYRRSLDTIEMLMADDNKRTMLWMVRDYLTEYRTCKFAELIKYQIATFDR